MTKPTDATPSLRSASNRPATPREPPPDKGALVQAARAGTLNNANTKRGTRGRQAVDRAAFLRRKDAHPDLPVREALGHRVVGSRPRIASFYADNPSRFVMVESISLRDTQRAGTYMGSVGALLDAKARGRADWSQASRAFEQRFRRWAPIGDYHLLADADAVVALEERRRGEEQEVIFDSGRSRPGRRRRVR